MDEFVISLLQLGFISAGFGSFYAVMKALPHFGESINLFIGSLCDTVVKVVDTYDKVDKKIRSIKNRKK